MYITSELFTTEPASSNQSSSTDWNAMSDWPENSLFPASLGKRKRNTDGYTENAFSSYSNQANGSPYNYNLEAALNPRQTLLRTRSLPVSHNDIRIFHTAHLPPGPRSLFSHDMPLAGSSSYQPPRLDLDGPPNPKHRRKILPPKASRVAPLATTTANPATSKPSSHDLRSCKICHKAPTRNRDLETYISCQACGERACQICTRMCEGGCAKLVCSACCKEVGNDGDAWCVRCVEKKEVGAGDRMV
ncbi:uncharacterized protein BDZ99DRAFT_465567 [Mytilinidion resinicola]|uniref:Uncharacterized protein n=1 Tax=Mytilinidion resinicola TaxID=574789 RepID=A0A6A6YD70_9PEZI|nr:uncharacterized protein BDZ99DRAFT_465567 [Mytilinidion resinicola]KAF2806771.1 hypothetical protein BDZ99DRAFT_465567 [Mytilinidion resinicola]